jgi:hypothetical protein
MSLATAPIVPISQGARTEKKPSANSSKSPTQIQATLNRNPSSKLAANARTRNALRSTATVFKVVKFAILNVPVPIAKTTILILISKDPTCSIMSKKSY